MTITTATRVLVTGATGFIGYHCLEPLVRSGAEVLGLYRQGTPPEVPGVQWIQGDVMDRSGMRALFAKYRPGGLLHLAWFVEPSKVIADPISVNLVAASLDLVHEFRVAGGERCTIAGSCYEYDWKYGYCSEAVTPCEPDTMYGVAKDALRRAFLGYCANTGLSGAWGRAFFMYGPRENPARLVSSVALSLLQGKPAKSSHGLQIRDYMHVQDVADGLVALFKSQCSGAYNIACGAPISIRDIVQQLGEITGRQDLLQIGALPARANDVPLVLGDGRKMLADTGWKPSLSLAQGLESTVRWWQDELNFGRGQR
ncbi:MAG: NAD-dependent epimerase/dehydratase family protein [Steroidobacteraceae bacterium]